MLTSDELRQIRRLHLQASRKVSSPFSGEYRSAFRGQGMEFEEVRPYLPGNDVRRIDWNVTARTGAPFVKEFREERQLTLMLVLDLSASTLFGSGGRDGRTTKRLQIARLAGALAFAAIRTGDRVGMITFTDKVDTYLPPRRSRGHVWAVVRAAFEQAGNAHKRTDLRAVFEEVGRLVKRRSVVCIASDFLSDTAYERELGILARRHNTNGFLIHDPLERAVPSVGLVEVEDAETGQRRVVDTSAFRAQRTVEGRIQQLRRLGVRARSIGTEEDPFALLLAHFRTLERMR
jgi:uncharacterized protein (DUF58 family)